MFYITVKQSPVYHQMTLEELWFGKDEDFVGKYRSNKTNTRTYEVRYISDRFKKCLDTEKLIQTLKKFNEQTDNLRGVDRHSLYYEFKIPKKSGGLRKIDAPEPPLMEALRNLKAIFENEFNAMYHTASFAYVHGRSTIDAVKRHQQNESNWFAKFDLSNFFGSTTLEYTMKMFSMIYPFSELFYDEDSKEELRKALELAFLDGGLPQGTPISPLITNIIMIPIDYKLYNAFRKYEEDGEEKYLVYTRYADDFIISSRYGFSCKGVQDFIKETLSSFGAPFSINEKKTRYGSRAGSNWNLGVMLNKDNNITLGYKERKRFKAMISSYAKDKKNGVTWEYGDIKSALGTISYHRMVEGKENINGLIRALSNKFDIDIESEMKRDVGEYSRNGGE